MFTLFLKGSGDFFMNNDPFGYGKPFVVPSIPIGLLRRAAASGGGSGFTKLTASETPDGSNTIFTFAQKPTYIVSGGAWYEENSGWTWNSGALQATMDTPAPSSQTFWGFV